MKQVLRIGRKEALAKSSHYRRMERFGIGSARSAERAAPPSLLNKTPVVKLGSGSRVAEINQDKKAAPKIAVARLQPAPRSLRPLLLVSSFHIQKSPTGQAATELVGSTLPKPLSKEDEDDASDYGEDNEEVPLARHPCTKTGAGLLSHFSDSSFGSRGLAASSSDSTLSSMSSLTPSSSVGSLADSLNDSSTVSLASSVRCQEVRLIHNVPCIPLNAESLQA